MAGCANMAMSCSTLSTPDQKKVVPWQRSMAFHTSPCRSQHTVKHSQDTGAGRRCINLSGCSGTRHMQVEEMMQNSSSIGPHKDGSGEGRAIQTCRQHKRMITTRVQQHGLNLVFSHET
jgi:hypothetical protein